MPDNSQTTRAPTNAYTAVEKEEMDTFLKWYQERLIRCVVGPDFHTICYNKPHWPWPDGVVASCTVSSASLSERHHQVRTELLIRFREAAL